MVWTSAPLLGLKLIHGQDALKYSIKTVNLQCVT